MFLQFVVSDRHLLGAIGVDLLPHRPQMLPNDLIVFDFRSVCPFFHRAQELPIAIDDLAMPQHHLGSRKHRNPFDPTEHRRKDPRSPRQKIADLRQAQELSRSRSGQNGDLFKEYSRLSVGKGLVSFTLGCKCSKQLNRKSRSINNRIKCG